MNDETKSPDKNGESRSRWWLWLLAALSLCASLALYGFAVRYGAVNQDEGWYLYASRISLARWRSRTAEQQLR